MKSTLCFSICKPPNDVALANSWTIYLGVYAPTKWWLFNYTTNEFANQLYGRCYLLREQLSKDQSSTSNISKYTGLCNISQAASPWCNHRICIRVMMGRAALLSIIVRNLLVKVSRIKRDITDNVLPGVEIGNCQQTLKKSFKFAKCYVLAHSLSHSVLAVGKRKRPSSVFIW